MIIIIHENAIGCVDYFGSDRSVGAFVVFNNNSIINIIIIIIIIIVNFIIIVIVIDAKD